MKEVSFIEEEMRNLAQEEPGDATKERSETGTLSREECVEIAKKGDIVEWCRKQQVELERIETQGGSDDESAECYRRADLEGVIIGRHWWCSESEEAGKLNRYQRGGMPQFITEFEGVSIDEALQITVSDTMPGAVVPPGDPLAGLTNSERSSIKKRVSRTRCRGGG